MCAFTHSVYTVSVTTAITDEINAEAVFPSQDTKVSLFEEEIKEGSIHKPVIQC